MNLPKAILFDNDGVLVASEPWHWAAWQKLLPELGLPYPRELVERSVGLTSPQILEKILDLYRPGWTRAEWDLEALARRKNDFYLEMARTGLAPYPGVPEGLAWLKSRGVKIAAVSNAKRNELTRALECVRLASFFDVLISREDAPAPKPDPSPYLAACAHLDVEPSEAFAVEDSPTGLEAALFARVPSIAIESNFSRYALENAVPGRPDLKPAQIFASMREFFSWLESA